MQTCMWPSWCHCHSLSLASVKSRLVLLFWYRLTWVVLDKGPLNGCVCVCVCERPVIEFSESIWTIWAFLELGKYGTYAFLVMSITMSLCVCMCVCVCRAFNCRILYNHYLPTVILIVILIIIGIPSPTHSFTLGLNPSFSANLPYRSLSFFSFRIYYMISQTVYCYFWAYPSFYFLVFLFLHIFSCRFHAVD